MWSVSVLCALLACFAASVLVCAWLWWSGQRAVRRLEKQFANSIKTIEEQASAWKQEAASCRRRIDELEDELRQLRQVQTPRPGMNLTRRTMALRMKRRGERPEQIAAALGLPRAEVELLLKLHSAALGASGVAQGERCYTEK